jgi:hypothetical protein
VQSEWRRLPFAARKYEKISGYVPGLGGFSEADCDQYLGTHLEGFLGQPYNYDDQELSEQWMRTLAKDESLKRVRATMHKEMVEAQVGSVVYGLTRVIQDRYSNQIGTLHKPEKQVGREVEERPVWGIDAYTRRMIEMALDLSPLTTDAQKSHFIEKVSCRCWVEPLQACTHPPTHPPLPAWSATRRSAHLGLRGLALPCLACGPAAHPAYGERAAPQRGTRHLQVPGQHPG